MKICNIEIYYILKLCFCSLGYRIYHNKALSLCKFFINFLWEILLSFLGFYVHRMYLGLMFVWLTVKYVI